MHEHTLIGRAGLAVALLTLLPPAVAQIEHPGSAIGDLLPVLIDGVVVAAPDVAALVAEDQRTGPVPLRYGVPLDVDVDLATDGQWDTAPDGTLVWRVSVSSPGALSLGLELAAFDLPRGAKLFAYDPALVTVFGAFTSQNEAPDGELTIRPVPGDEVVLELQLPSEQPDLPRLAVDRVVYDYRDVYEMMAMAEAGVFSGGAEGGCTVNVNCSVGNPYGDFKRAAVRTLSSGFLCSGVLLNNTAEDGTQYLYTAHHCGTSSNVIVTYNYQTSSCGGGGAPTGQTTSGATLLASHAVSDGRLLRINPQIPSSYQAYFMGWSRSTSSLSTGISMHHPNGGPKCISLDSNGGGQGAHLFESGVVIQTWDMNFQTGGTLGGSSGGALIDQNDRVRGVLSGGPQSCFVSYYGRFHTFWNSSNIAQFLDPAGTGATNLGGFDPSGGGGGGGGCSVAQYGVGLGGANIGFLSSSSTPEIGTTLLWSYSGFNPNLSGLLILSGTQTATLALGGTILVDYLNPAFTLSISTDGSGAGTGTFTLPDSPAWIGIDGYSQVGIIDASQSAGWAFSNGVAFTFCAG